MHRIECWYLEAVRVMQDKEHRQYRVRNGLWNQYRRLFSEIRFRTDQGRFILRTNDRSARAMYIARGYEREMLAAAMVVARSITGKSKGTGGILDVGANIGQTSIAAIVTREVRWAYAFEPDILSFQTLLRNIRLNALSSSVSAVNKAVSDSSRRTQMEICPTSSGDHRVVANGKHAQPDRYGESGRRIVTVESTTLDNYTFVDLSIVWVDVQGHEGHVFLGGDRLLRSGVPTMAEIWPYGIYRSGMSKDQFCRIVEGLWSEYWLWTGGEFVRHPISDMASIFDALEGEVGHENVVFAQ